MSPQRIGSPAWLRTWYAASRPLVFRGFSVLDALGFLVFKPFAVLSVFIASANGTRSGLTALALAAASAAWASATALVRWLVWRCGAGPRRRWALLMRTCLLVTRLVASHPPCGFSASRRTGTTLSVTFARYVPPIVISSFFMTRSPLAVFGLARPSGRHAPREGEASP